MAPHSIRSEQEWAELKSSASFWVRVKVFLGLSSPPSVLRLEELSAEERAATVKAMADALPADRKARAAAIRDGKILYPSVVDEIDPNDPDILAALNT